ncbi:MAG: flagellar basal body P-ring protein FlgI [Oligoflexia bacterium]|nr:flagellar basal body P-ring protein FlgI [Oligoflexia bacterium]
MRLHLGIGLVCAIYCLIAAECLLAEVRLKDLVTIKGVRDNFLIGYGMVIGLNGTGDGGSEMTNASMKRMLQKFGLNTQKEISTKNVATVVVTAKLPAFARMGQKIDVTVSSIGDASSLAGGTLLVTPLKGGDGEIYAVSSGAVSIGGLKQGAKFATSGRITSGAVVEKEIEFNFDQKNALRLSLNNPDFTMSYRVEKIINNNLGGKFAISKDATTIDLMVPAHYQRKIVELVALVENLKVNVDNKAKIVINERTGTIVAGGEVVLKEVAIAHGDLMIEVGKSAGTGGAGGGGGGGGGAKGAGKGVKESFFYIDQGATLNDLVKGLNALGTTPEDLIAIFQALKQNGSIIGDIDFI